MSADPRLSTRPLPSGWEADGEPVWGAALREDGTPRLRLAVDYRQAGRLGFVLERQVSLCMLNPSGASHLASDATITRVLIFMGRAGYGRVRVVNRWPFRATSPADLVRAIEAGEDVGEGQPWADLLSPGGDLVLGWGKPSSALLRRRLLTTLPDALRQWSDLRLSLSALALTDDGWPRHPLMLPSDCRPRPVAWAESLNRFVF